MAEEGAKGGARPRRRPRRADADLNDGLEDLLAPEDAADPGAPPEDDEDLPWVDPPIPMEAEGTARGPKAWFEVDDEAGDEGEDPLSRRKQALPDPWGDEEDGSEDAGATARGAGVETARARRHPKKPLPMDDDLPLFKGGGKGGATPFKEEDDNKELKGCLIVILLGLVAGLAWFFLKDMVGGDEEQEVARRSPPPITRVEAMAEKTVVHRNQESGPALARKLVAPEEPSEDADDTEAASADKRATSAAVVGMPGPEGEAALKTMVGQLETEMVCLNGRPAQRVSSLYGLPGGFAVSYGAGPTDGPRLEFMPPARGGEANVLYYVAFGEPVARGFEGNRARAVPNNSEAVQRIILAWVADMANGACDP